MKNKFIKKAIATCLSAVMVVGTCVPLFAASSGDVWSLSKYKLDKSSYKTVYWTDASGSKHNAYADNVYLYNESHSSGWKDPVYCVQPNKSSATTGNKLSNITSTSYYKNDLDADAQWGLKMASIYGYPNSKTSYSSNSEKSDYQLATQCLIWEYVTGKRRSADNLNPTSEFYSVIKNYSGAVSAYKNIVWQIQNHSKRPSFTGSTTTGRSNKMSYDAASKKYKITFTDTNKVFDSYNLTKNSNSNISVSKNGNTLTLTSSKPITSDATLTFTKKNTNSNSAYLLQNGDNQKMLYGTMSQPVYAYLKVYSDNTGSLQIYKVDQDQLTDKITPMAGVQFIVSNSALKYSKTITTNASGYATLTDLVAGKEYTVTEVLPDGYNVPTNSVNGKNLVSTFTATSGGTVKITYTNSKLDPGRIKVEKKDEATGVLLEGAEFTVYSDAECKNVVDVIVTGSDGTAETKELSPGAYYVKETKAPTGYLLSTETRTAVVTSNEEYTVPFTDSSRGLIDITKYDANNHNALEGAEFTIYSDEGCTESVGKYITNEAGFIETEPLALGTYYIKETKAPEGYLKSDEVKTVELVSGRVEVDVNTDRVNVKAVDASNYIKTSFTISSPTDTELTNYKNPFNDFYYVAASSDIDQFMIDNPEYSSSDARSATAGLKGIFYVKDEGAYYVVTDESRYICFSDEEKAQAFKLKSNVWYYETSTNDYALYTGGVPFEDTDYSSVYSTTALNSIKKTFTDNDVNNIEFTYGTVNAKVTTTVGTPINSVWVGLYYNNALVPGTSANTDENGNCSFSNVALGIEYTIKEIPGANDSLNTRGYENSTMSETIELSSSEKTASVTLKNDVLGADKYTYTNCIASSQFEDTPIVAVLHKSDVSTAAPVPGARIAIYNSKDQLYYDNSVDANTDYNFTTDENGDITLYAIPVDTYTFYETYSPDGYFVNTTVFTFTVNADGTISGDTEFTNTPTEISIHKTDAITGNNVEGATYTFYNALGNEVGTAITNADGVATIRQLPFGSYTYKETIAPEGYVLDSTEHSVEILADGTILGETETIDDPISVSLAKIGKNGLMLSGATFEVYNSDGTLYKTIDTTEGGLAELQYIPVGDYIFIETEAPEGYGIDMGEYTFTVNEDGSVTGTTSITDEITKVTIKKIDSKTGKGLAGAVIGIYDENGKIVNKEVKTIDEYSGAVITEDHSVTDSNGEITVEGLPVGTYTFKEIIAPEGYQINDQVYEFTINPDGSITDNLTIEDDLIVEKVNTGGYVALAATVAVISACGITCAVKSKKSK